MAVDRFEGNDNWEFLPFMAAPRFGAIGNGFLCGCTSLPSFDYYGLAAVRTLEGGRKPRDILDIKDMRDMLLGIFRACVF